MPQTDSKSSSRQEQQQTTTETISSSSSSYQQIEEDTIDLYELSVTLWKNKWIIVSSTIVAVLGSIVFALITPTIYKAESLLLPPKEKDFQALNILEVHKRITTKSEFVSLSKYFDPETVFSEFKQNLKSRKIQKKFINEKGLMELLFPGQTSKNIDEGVYKGFAQLINIESENNLTTLSIEMHDGEIASKLVNDFIEFVNKETIIILVEDLNDKIEHMIRDIKYTIASKRALAERRREDQIIRYSEHAEIAKKLGMVGRVDATNIIQNTQMNANNTGIRRQTTATSPLYYLGYEALMTEIGILRDRKSDDPFITGLRDLQEQLALLNAVNIEKENMSSVHIDEKAFPPISPIKPNRRLIVTIGSLAGMFSGIFLIFFIEYIKTQRKKHSE